MPEDYMSIDVFQSRLDEFSDYDYKTYCRACRKIQLKHGVTSWSDISELKLGKVFRELEKELIKRTFRTRSMVG